MRNCNFLIVIGLFALFSVGPAFAQAIPGYPAWKLDKIEKSGEQEGESVVLEYADYFALYPNDSRPPITIDGGTATRLLNGQANPETIYYNRTQGAAELAKQQAAGGGSGGNGAVGWQVAEATYVPLGEAKSGKATSSISTVVGAGGASAGFAGGAAGAGGKAGASSGSAADMIAAAQAAAAGGGVRGGASGAGGQGNFSASGFLGNPSRGPTALPEPTADTGADANLTYSQMIEKATGTATVSACARMGSYAPAGACK